MDIKILRLLLIQKKIIEQTVSESITKEFFQRDVVKENVKETIAVNRVTGTQSAFQEKKDSGVWAQREVNLCMNELNQSIGKGEYGKYINEGWENIGAGDGRNILAESKKMKYESGNVKIKEIDAQAGMYVAIPGRALWTGKDLCSDAMKECYVVNGTAEGANYKLVKIQRPGILQKRGEEFIVRQKGAIEITRTI